MTWDQENSAWTSHGAARRQNFGTTFVIGQRDKLEHPVDPEWEMHSAGQFEGTRIRNTVVVNIRDEERAKRLQERILKIIEEER